MRVITFGRTVALPVSVVVFALAVLSTPASPIRSVLLLVGIAALGVCLLAVARWWRAFRSVNPEKIQTTTDDASALVRMGGKGR
jgi:hypothetical protein